MLKNNHTGKKNKLFLGLMKKFRDKDLTTVIKNAHLSGTYGMPFKHFIKSYVNLLNIIYILTFLHTQIVDVSIAQNPTIYKLLNFYAKLAKLDRPQLKTPTTSFHTYNINNIVTFTRPKKQIFLNIFSNKPIFIFTGGLMRKVMNEKRKCNKKMYKVATSLIKLTAILLIRKIYFDTCYLKLSNIGQLRYKVLSAFSKYRLNNIINYVVVCPRMNLTSQKFNTRRSIKKYIKKRFKLNN